MDTLVYAGTRLEIEELHRLKNLLAIKYGDGYVMAAETNANNTVKEVIVAKLAVRNMPDSLIIVRLKQLAREMNIECNLPSYDESMEQNPFGGGMDNSFGGNPFGGNSMGGGNQFDPNMGGQNNNPFGQGANPYGNEFGGFDAGNQFDYMKNQGPGNPFGGFNNGNQQNKRIADASPGIEQQAGKE